VQKLHMIGRIGQVLTYAKPYLLMIGNYIFRKDVLNHSMTTYVDNI